MTAVDKNAMTQHTASGVAGQIPLPLDLPEGAPSPDSRFVSGRGKKAIIRTNRIRPPKAKVRGCQSLEERREILAVCFLRIDSTEFLPLSTLPGSVCLTIRFAPTAFTSLQRLVDWPRSTIGTHSCFA